MISSSKLLFHFPRAFSSFSPSKSDSQTRGRQLSRSAELTDFDHVPIRIGMLCIFFGFTILSSGLLLHYYSELNRYLATGVLPLYCSTLRLHDFAQITFLWLTLPLLRNKKFDRRPEKMWFHKGGHLWFFGGVFTQEKKPSIWGFVLIRFLLAQCHW